MDFIHSRSSWKLTCGIEPAPSLEAPPGSPVAHCQPKPLLYPRRPITHARTLAHVSGAIAHLSSKVPHTRARADAHVQNTAVWCVMMKCVTTFIRGQIRKDYERDFSQYQHFMYRTNRVINERSGDAFTLSLRWMIKSGLLPSSGCKYTYIHTQAFISRMYTQVHSYGSLVEVYGTRGLRYHSNNKAYYILNKRCE